MRTRARPSVTVTSGAPSARRRIDDEGVVAGRMRRIGNLARERGVRGLEAEQDPASGNLDGAAARPAGVCQGDDRRLAPLGEPLGDRPRRVRVPGIGAGALADGVHESPA